MQNLSSTLKGWMMTEYKKCKSEEGNLGRRAGHAVTFPMISGNQIKGKTRKQGSRKRPKVK